MPNRAGKLIQNFSGELAYFSFYPNDLPPQPPLEINASMQGALIEAHRLLALLDGLSDRIPNKDLFISMYVRKEALLSSQIEGTQCTLEDILDPRLEPKQNLDVSDVVNYVQAMHFATEALKKLPLCQRFFRQLHEILMQGVRGAEKTPGSFRTSQNWIGGLGSTLKTAYYIPPNPQDMIECLTALERFIHQEDGMDPLIKSALLHYQFETIHPFLDGNGRVGRMLIPLYLMSQNCLSSPILYLSYYLKANRIEYYDRLSELRRTGNYEQWVHFFLRGIAETASDAISTIDQLGDLHQKDYVKLKSAPPRKQGKLLELFTYLETNPILDTVQTAKALSWSRTTTATYISELCDLQILRPFSKSGKAQIFAYDAMLEILRKGT